MIKIVIDDKGVRGLISELQRKSRDLSPAMRQIAGIMMRAVEDNFEAEGRPKWPGLRPSTIKQRQREGKWPGKMLQKSAGGLASSISRRSDSSSATVGTNKVYAAIHQFGGKAGRGRKVTIPARPFLQLTDEDMGEIKDVLMRYVRGRSRMC
ncbi:MAG: phage virion morphogenesis protein [Nitrospirales bacterium]|nr:phage virion morphogenesis protein [Nitrospirales bacterium]